MLPIIEQYVNELFGSEQKMGVKYYPTEANNDDSVESFIGNGDMFPATCCTSYAMVIYYLCKKVGIPAKIYGFANSENPESEFVKRKYHPGGHDFVVLFDEFIVDPWPLLFAMNGPNRVLFDVQHPAVKAFYGTAWRHMEAAETFADNYCELADTVKVFEDRMSWVRQLKSLLNMWKSHQLRGKYNAIQINL